MRRVLAHLALPTVFCSLLFLSEEKGYPQTQDAKTKTAPAIMTKAANSDSRETTLGSEKDHLSLKDTKTQLPDATEGASPEAKKNPELSQTGILLGTRKRDPFRPFTLNTRTAPTRKRESLSPLERYELGQLKLVGVVADPRNINALVEDASGLGYVVKLGTPIGVNDGKVVAIRRDGIIVEEVFVDLYGAQKKRQVNMKLTAENPE